MLTSISRVGKVMFRYMVFRRFKQCYFRVAVTNKATANSCILWCNTSTALTRHSGSLFGRMLSLCSIAIHYRSSYPSLPASFARCIISCVTAAWQQQGQKAPGIGPIEIKRVTMPFSRVVQPPTVSHSGTSWGRLFWLECEQLFLNT